MGIKRMPYTVPEGYFDNLRKRLSAIPQPDSAVPYSGIWMQIRPYLALAASFVLILIGGTAVLRVTSSPDKEASAYETLLMADLIPVTSPDYAPAEYQEALYGEAAEVSGEEEVISDDDVINYLIANGTSVEQMDMD